MKRWQWLALLVSIPLALVGLAWQAGRYASLNAEVRSLERQERDWREANGKLQGGITVLQSRERAAELAKQLGLERATATRRIFIETPGGDQ
jgi:cell division protein FtsL